MSEIFDKVLRVKINNEWVPIPAIRGTSAYVQSCTTISQEVGGRQQYGYELVIYDEKTAAETSSYNGNVIKVWNGIDAGELSLSVDGIQHSDGSNNIKLDAVRYVQQSDLRADTTAQAIARENINAIGFTNPSDKQIPCYSTNASAWVLTDFTPASIGAVPTSRTINTKSLNGDITLDPGNIGAIHSSLTINNKTITNPTTSSASIKLDADDIGAVPTTRTVNGYALSSDIRTQTIASNKSVPAWNTADASSSIYSAGFPYYADISIAEVTADMVPEVIFNINDAMSGIFAPIAETQDGKVRIYASEIPENTVTIPTIICFNKNREG